MDLDIDMFWGEEEEIQNLNNDIMREKKERLYRYKELEITQEFF